MIDRNEDTVIIFPAPETATHLGSTTVTFGKEIITLEVTGSKSGDYRKEYDAKTFALKSYTPTNRKSGDRDHPKTYTYIEHTGMVKVDIPDNDQLSIPSKDLLRKEDSSNVVLIQAITELGKKDPQRGQELKANLAAWIEKMQQVPQPNAPDPNKPTAPELHYRDDPVHIPYDNRMRDGQIRCDPIPGGAWVKYGMVEAPERGDDLFYNTGHGIIALITPQYNIAPADRTDLPKRWQRQEAPMFLAPNTELNQQILRKLGAQQTDRITVPNLKQIEHKTPAGKTLKPCLAEFMDDLEGPFSQGVDAQIGMRLQTGEVCKITGIAYRERGQQEEKTLPPVEKSGLLCTFNRTGGLLTFVDRDGQQYLARDSDELAAWLQDRLFFTLHQELSVPLTQGEEIIRTNKSYGAAELLRTYAPTISPAAPPAPNTPAVGEDDEFARQAAALLQGQQRVEALRRQGRGVLGNGEPERS